MPTSLQSRVEGTARTDYLYDAWARLYWADRDAKAFEELSAWFVHSGAYTVRTEFNGDCWQASFHRAVKPRVEARRLLEISRVLGSFLDHNRAALNYLAYQMARQARRKKPSLTKKLRPESTEFPIFRSPALFRKKNRVKQLPDEYRDAFERVQPYRGRYPGLWMLHELARESRHRVIHPTAIFSEPDSYEVVVDGEALWADEIEIVPRKRLEDGDVFLYFSLPFVSPDADMDANLAIAVGIDHALCRGLVGLDVIDQIREDTYTVLDSLGTEFFPT